MPVQHHVFVVSPVRSAIVVRARSNVGPIDFSTTNLTGTVDICRDAEGVVVPSGAAARIEVPVGDLASGNNLYDAELRRRVDARRFPRAVLELRGADRIPGGDRFHLKGDLTFHGATQAVEGTVQVRFPDTCTVVVTGEHVFDIRDFDVGVPTMMMLKIFPDVRVELHLEARVEG